MKNFLKNLFSKPISIEERRKELISRYRNSMEFIDSARLGTDDYDFEHV
jgi:hypothetical protein